MASTGSIGITRPMKKVTQVSPRKVSATESRLRAARLATLLARPQARCQRPKGAPGARPCVAKGDRISLFSPVIPTEAERSEAQRRDLFWWRQPHERVPRLRHPSGGFARDDGYLKFRSKCQDFRMV